MAITKVVCNTCDIQLEAGFELPSLALLSEDEQDFVVAFLHYHGSIKHTGEQLGVSYPTVKSRLTAIVNKLPGVVTAQDAPATEANDVLTMLEEGEISVNEALKLLD